MNEKKDLLFVGGDLSGIQKFIYNISSKKAMVSLKGRSAYLKQYMDKVCEKLEKRTAGNNKDVVYCSGGKFYVIVENTENNILVIENLQKEVEQELWNEHKGQLALNICYVPFSFNEDKTKVFVDGCESTKLGILWQNLTQQFNDLKYQKFKKLLLDDYDAFFGVTEIGEKPEVCAITGIEGKCESITKDENGEEIKVLPSVKKQIDLGQEIRDKEHFKMLEEYADDSYLGVLRMDVDKLGSLFANGFETIEKYKKISGTLDSFFSDQKEKRSGKIIRESVLHQIQRQDKYKDDMNIVYAGGDDIFAVGRWDKIIEFAYDVHEAFVKHINNPDVTISGGIAIVGSKFPIAKSAEMSGNAEEAAKRYDDGKGHLKNAFNMFGETVSWNFEFDYLQRYKKQFVNLIDKSGLSKGILHRIMTYAEMAKSNERIKQENEKGNMKKKPNLSYVWHKAYYLSRYIEQNKKNSDVVDFCKDLRDKQLLGNRNYELMAVAARWAELELREKTN